MFTDFRVEEPEALADRLQRVELPPSVYHQLRETASRHESRLAWRFLDTGTERTWGSVLRAVDSTAAALSTIGIGPDAHVGVMSWNREEYALTWLALSRQGAVMVPINPAYTSPEIRHVEKTSGMTHLIVEPEMVPLIQASELEIQPERIVVLDQVADGYGTSWDALFDRRQGDIPEPASLGSDALLNLQYTSGTTGFPKACMLSNDYWLCLGLGSTEQFGVDLQRFYCGSSFFYMVGQRILMNAMFSGGAVYFPRRPGAKRYMVDISRNDCDYCGMFENIVKQPVRPVDSDHNLRLVNIFAFSSKNQKELHQRFNVAGQEYYGMTEIGGALYMPAHRVLEKEGSGSCGVVAPFREVYIADEDGNPVKTGDTGELCVKGRGILQGYYGNPDATSDAFRNGYFRTGDLAYRDADGYHFIVGRIKDMVRRSGENISAREVESSVRSMSEVQECAVVPVPDDYRGEEVKLYVQLVSGVTQEQCPPDSIVQHCLHSLAPFKVPRYIEYRRDFPMTDSQRVKKKVLVTEKEDLRSGSFDRVCNIWR